MQMFNNISDQSNDDTSIGRRREAKTASRCNAQRGNRDQLGLLDSPPSYPDHGDDDDDGDDASDGDDDGNGDDGDGDDENRKLISEVETIGSEWPLLPTDPLNVHCTRHFHHYHLAGTTCDLSTSANFLNI